MGWSDCFDFDRLEFTRPDAKATEIQRVLKTGGIFSCCSWETQEDLKWMEQAMLRDYPELQQDGDYLQQRPIGAAYEKPEGYEIIFRTAGFRDIKISRTRVELVSTDEEEWWQQMSYIGWDHFFDKINQSNASKFQELKDTIFEDLQPYKKLDGIHFTKTAFYVSGVK
jgi:hypothetical protein